MLLSAVCSAPVNAASAIPQPVSMTLDGHSCLCCGSKVTQGAVVVCWGAAFVSGGPEKGSLMCLWQLDSNIANSPGMAAAIFSHFQLETLNFSSFPNPAYIAPKEKAANLNAPVLLYPFPWKFPFQSPLLQFPCHVTEL